MALNKSFISILDALSAAITADADVSAFCQAQYGKALTIRYGVREVKEIPAEMCPMVLMTRVEQEPKLIGGMMGEMSDKVLLYILIFNNGENSGELPNIQPGFIDVTTLEELVDQAVQRADNLGGLVKQIKPLGSGYDEGSNYPRFAVVKGIEILWETNLLSR